jgi:hypothetical protein
VRASFDFMIEFCVRGDHRAPSQGNGLVRQPQSVILVGVS